jgi:hypothetical protein
MRIIIAALLGLSFVVGLAMPISAQANERHGYYKKKKQKQYRYIRPREEESRNRSDYYEHLADKFPRGLEQVVRANGEGRPVRASRELDSRRVGGSELGRGLGQ